MIKKVVKSNALYGRIDLEINLQPFSFFETHLFYNKKKLYNEVMDIYLTLGGIPQYLLEINPDKSFIQNLKDMAFSPNGYFFREYQRLFISHFSNNIK